MIDDAARQRLRFLTGLIENTLSEYEAGRSDLAQLVNGVESVIDSLTELADARWVAELRKEWARLEIVYALMLDGGRTAPDDDERRDVADAVSALRSLLER